MAVMLYFLKSLGCDECDAEVTIEGKTYYIHVADYDIARNTAEVPDECRECIKNNSVGELLLNL